MYVWPISPYTVINCNWEKSAKTTKNVKIENATRNTDMNVYWKEEISTLTLTMITIAQNIKFPSIVSPPIYPNSS